MKKYSAILTASAVGVLILSNGATAIPRTDLITGVHLPVIEIAAKKHKMRSASFLKAALEKKGVTVTDVRRHGQIYLFRVEDSGTVAIVSVDGYSAKIIGVHVLTYAAGVTQRPAGSAGVYFIDFSYEFGYIVELTVFESYTEITSEELAMSEEYTEVSYEESEEVSYEDVAYEEGTTEEEVADLDQGDDGDQVGDTEADVQDNADEPADEGMSDDSGSDDSGSADDGDRKSVV